jgi:hypothetical protein
MQTFTPREAFPWNGLCQRILFTPILWTFLLYFLVILELELRTLHLLGICCRTGATSPAFIALIMFRIGSCISPWAGLDCNPSIHTSEVIGMTGSCTIPSCSWLRWGLMDFLPGTTSNLLISASRVARTTVCAVVPNHSLPSFLSQKDQDFIRHMLPFWKIP